MKEKGFTLVELLGVLVILAVIFLLVYPAVNRTLSDSKDTIYQNQINTILDAAYDFSLEEIKYLPNTDEVSYITLGQLKYEGLIDVDIKNPIDKSVFPDNLVISIENVGANYEYSNKNSKLRGNYLYTVEVEKIDDSSTLLPIITLNDLTKNSNGNYIITLNLNEEFNDISYSAVSSTGVDLTDKIIRNILLNGEATETIDTSKPNVYKINYSVVDEEGYASIAILNVIIADTELPVIVLPEENTISLDITTFDLLNGVTCTDNSGFCDITTSGDIEFGTEGKYIIEYTGKDPSGNTTTKKRVITIE